MRMGRGAWIFVMACLAGWACSSEPEPSQVNEEEEEEILWERPFEASGQMRWVRGDLHVHSRGASNDAAPESTPERIREVAIERGLDFVVLTDHSNSTGSDPWTREEDPALYNQGPEFPFWDRVAGLSEESFILVQGNELSPVDAGELRPTGHIGCIPRSLTDFDPNIAFVDRPRGEVTGGEALQQALDANCLAILNHPYGPSWISYDWTSYDYDAMEVWNGGARFNLYDHQGLKAWACDLSQGRRVTAIGASDNHKIEIEWPGQPLDPPLGMPATWVWVSNLDWYEVIDGLSAGAVAISDSEYPLDLDIFDSQGRWLAMQGGEVEAGVERWIQVRGARRLDEGARRLELVRIRRDACDDTREEGRINVPDPNWEVLESWNLTRAGQFEERVQVDVEEGDVFFAWMAPDLIEILHEDVAISGAIYIVAD